MTKVKVWLDSGANAFSNNVKEFDLEIDFGLTIDEWRALSEKEKEDIAKEYAWSEMEWGFYVEGEDE